MRSVTTEHIQTAYRKLKRLVYFDKTDLNLRLKLAEFECDAGFEENLLSISQVVNSDDPLQEPLFQQWLEKIDFRVVPKSLKNDFPPSENGIASESGKFISNVTSVKICCIDKVNYFFDGPIEIHLIAILWIMFEGFLLDAKLGDECFGSRLEDELSNPEHRSAGLFRKYHERYAKWRDSGIRKAEYLLTEEQTSVYILGLDIKEYYYHIRLDFSAIAKSIHEARLEKEEPPETEEMPSSLLRCLEAIISTYRKKILPFREITHRNLQNDVGIPIGLCSSQLLGNWYLRDFDREIKNLVRPAYYGRYVDDILLVVPANGEHQKKESPVASFMDQILVKTNILLKPQDKRYEIKVTRGLFLEQGKCILQYFDAKHSIAGLVKFQKKLEENGSDFLLLPVDEADNSLEDVAYDLLYEGSANKFRSVKAMAENRYELAKHLARQTILHVLTDDPPDYKISLGLQKFFKGKNAIEFSDLWERVFTFFVIANDLKSANDFLKNLRSEINRVRFKRMKSSNLDQNITSRLASNLRKHLDLCRAMSQTLGGALSELSDKKEALVFRRGNLIRHHFVRLPLINYTSYPGPLTTRSVEDKVDVDAKKLKWSPRYVNFDECLLLAESGDVNMNDQSPFEWACQLYKRINGFEVENIEWNSIFVNGEESDAEI